MQSDRCRLGLPLSLRPFCLALVVGSDAIPAVRLTEDDTFDGALKAFATRFPRPDQAALVSLWSLYYFAALIVPATVTALLEDRTLPVGFEDVGLVVGPDGAVTFRLRDDGRAGSPGRRFEMLVEGHLVPFVALCARRSGLSARLFWSNASVTFDWVLGELTACDTLPGPRREAEAMIAGGGRLANPYVALPDGERLRRICCLRHRLQGVAACAAICPHTRQTARRPPVLAALASAPSMR